MSYNKNLYTSSASALDAGIIYDQTETKMQSEVNAALKSRISSEATTRGNADTALQNTLNQLDSAKAAKGDLASINQTSPTCTVTNGIAKGTYFYLDGVLTRATADISENAPFTSSNCETVTAGGLNLLYAELSSDTTWKYLYLGAASTINIPGNAKELRVCLSNPQGAARSSVVQIPLDVPIMIGKEHDVDAVGGGFIGVAVNGSRTTLTFYQSGTSYTDFLVLYR